jgi:hypothetical protein
MRKEILVIAIILVTAGVFSSCKKDIDDIITMQVSPKMVMLKDTIDVNLIIENHTNKMFSYDGFFILEYFDKENWTHIGEICFDPTMIGKYLLPKAVIERPTCLSEQVLSISGRYRIAMEFTHSKNIGNGRGYIVYAVFEVK